MDRKFISSEDATPPSQCYRLMKLFLKEEFATSASKSQLYVAERSSAGVDPAAPVKRQPVFDSKSETLMVSFK